MIIGATLVVVENALVGGNNEMRIVSKTDRNVWNK